MNLFAKKKRNPPNSLRELILIVLRNHPNDCLFEAKFIQDVEKLEKTNLFRLDSENIVTNVHNLFLDNEIFCPHEKIDRRNSYKGKTLNAQEIIEILARSSTVEPSAHNRLVVGSNSTGPTNV